MLAAVRKEFYGEAWPITEPRIIDKTWRADERNTYTSTIGILCEEVCAWI